jgi:DNA-binding PucR family transcriptional regulator
VIGIGSRCETPLDFPKSFAEARRALNIRLNSATPEGASAYDELGFYRLVDAAHSDGAVEDFVREWLGVLLDYDKSKNSELVHTLSDYLECGGSYDHSAVALHIHRSTLRYRLGRIRELTGFDLRDVNTRFNLHAATRAWRFVNPEG